MDFEWNLLIRNRTEATQRKTTQTVATSRQYILTSILPKEYKAQSIITPSRLPSSREEGENVGFYTFVITAIVLSGGDLSDSKLRRHLNRMNANENLPMDKTADVLAKLVRQGYIEKVVEKSDAAEDDIITWCVGPRGKVEVPPKSIAAFVQEVWGDPPADLNKKIAKSLGMKEEDLEAEKEEVGEDAEGEEEEDEE
jgi:hypothetical protein